MPEVDCATHGVFLYKREQCPGCEQARVDGLVAHWKRCYQEKLDELQRTREQCLGEKSRLESSLRGARDILARHEEGEPEAPHGLRKLLEQRTYVALLAQWESLGKRYQREREDLEERLADVDGELRSLPVSFQDAAWEYARLCEPEGAKIEEALREQQRESELAAQQKKQKLAFELQRLEQRFGRVHSLGEHDRTYEDYTLLGAVDLCGRRYARIFRPVLARVYCVPWIDAFAENIGQRITVRWVEPEVEQVYRLHDSDGELPLA